MPSTIDRKCKTCPTLVARENRTGVCRPCYNAARAAEADCRQAATKAADPKHQITADREKQRLVASVSEAKLKYLESVKIIERQEKELEVLGLLKASTHPYVIKPVTKSSGTSEACAVVVLSDWHSEELVRGEVGDLNEYNPDIAKARAEKCFVKALRLIRLLGQDIKIPKILLPLLGDFITGNIHGEENAESNGLQPMHALVTVQNYLISGIQFLLDNTECELVIPCHSGNHARTTLKTRFASENGHSLEYLMYVHLRAYFRNEPRVTFIIPDGMHSYVQVYDVMIRFHHGHVVKYGGGVGGIYIPVNKAIAQWNKGKHADLDVFGHFHQMRDGGNFICNGSLIGYNAFALSIKADYEPPKQALFLIDNKRGRTCVWPIFVK